MRKSFQKSAFSGGVLAPRLHGRSDIEKYDLALADARNFFVDYLGPAMTRAGTEFLDYIQDDDEPARIFPFQFNENIGNTYSVLFSKDRIRFLQDGAYVLEAPVAITSFGPALATASVAHGYSNGDMVKIAGGTYILRSVTATEFGLLDPYGNTVDTTDFSATEVFRVYTLASPYATADLPELIFDQQLNEVVITHRNYAERKLTRTSAVDWSLTAISTSGYDTAVSGLTLTPSGSGSAGYIVAVIPVSVDGVEAPLRAASMARNAASVDYSVTAGSLKITWDTVAGAAKYNIYRSRIYADAGGAHYGVPLGYIGESFAPEFTDTNITPDFTDSPLRKSALLRPGGITQVDITATGSGYTSEPSVSASGGGSGFEGKVVTNADDEVIAVLILDPGKGYVNPTISITGGSGTGATATAQAASLTQSYNSATAVVQQRRVYGGSDQNPAGFFSSRIADFDNFNLSNAGLTTDPYEFVLSEKQVTNIRHVVETRDGMFLFTGSNVHLVRGADDTAISANSIRADLQSSEGSGFLQPLVIQRDHLFVTPTSESVFALTPSNLPTYFQTVDVSFLAADFFSAQNPLTSWAWAEDPHKLIWATRRDGTMLSCAYVREQNVSAWTWHTTQGFFESVSAIKENGADRVYIIAKRMLRGKEKRVIERMAVRDTACVETMWAVDCGLSSELQRPAANLTLQKTASGAFTALASNGVFSSADVGKILRTNCGGKYKISAYAENKKVTVTEIVTAKRLPDQVSLPTYSAGSWSLAELFTELRGLSHLEGLEVEILADGREEQKKTVSGGKVTLAAEASFAIVGLPYSGEIRTLPLTAADAVIDTNKKQVQGLGIRIHETRGLDAGDFDFYPLLFDTLDFYDTAPNWRTELQAMNIHANRGFDGSVTLKKRGPQHATVLSITMEVDLERQS